MAPCAPKGARFQFLGIPPKGEPRFDHRVKRRLYEFPISRDPPEGGTIDLIKLHPLIGLEFPISRDPPEGGTSVETNKDTKGSLKCFQFLGIPPKGEPSSIPDIPFWCLEFPISRDPPEGGTGMFWGSQSGRQRRVSNF